MKAGIANYDALKNDSPYGQPLDANAFNADDANYANGWRNFREALNTGLLTKKLRVTFRITVGWDRSKSNLYLRRSVIGRKCGQNYGSNGRCKKYFISTGRLISGVDLWDFL